MTFPLESRDNVEKNYLFWLIKFFAFKMTTLSNRHIHNPESLNQSLIQIKQSRTMEDINSALKQARNVGMIGINTYATPLLKLGGYIKTSRLISLKEIDEEFLSEFITIHTANLSNASKRNYRIALIGFFGFIDKNNRSENGESFIFNIQLKFLSGTRGKSGVKLPTFLKESELERFLGAIDTAPMSNQNQARDRLIVKLLVYTGMRVSEAINLTYPNIIPENEVFMLNIQGKGDKYRVVMIKKSHIQNLLNEWLSHRNTILHIQNNLLFCNKNGKALSQPYIYGIVKNILRSIGIKKEKMGAHMLRHSFATLLYQKHKDLVLVQEALGHADLNTSRIYTHFDTSKLMKAASLMDDLQDK